MSDNPYKVWDTGSINYTIIDGSAMVDTKGYELKPRGNIVSEEIKKLARDLEESLGLVGKDRILMVPKRRKQKKGNTNMSFNSNNTGGYIQPSDGVFMPIPKQVLQDALPSGVYGVGQDRDGNILFSKSNLNCDKIIDIPSVEYQTLVSESERFLMPETKERFSKYGFIYKRSFLLHGAPGVGKSVLVNRLAKEVLDQGGIVLFNTNPQLLVGAFSALNATNPTTLKLCIFEEMDEWLEDYETEFLSLLDGEIQTNGVMFIGTTNYFDRIPKRIIRPGRFSTILEVKAPSLEGRIAFLSTKIDDTAEVRTIAEATAGLTIDELKELILGVKVFQYPLDMIKKRIKESRA